MTMPGGLRLLLSPTLCIFVVIGVTYLPLCAAQDASDAEAWRALQSALPEVFAAPATDPPYRFTPTYETHHFLWVIAADCAMATRNPGAYRLARRLLVERLFGDHALLAPGDVVYTLHFADRFSHSAFVELSVCRESYEAQMRGLREGVPREDELDAGLTPRHAGAGCDAGRALNVCMEWASLEYRRGWRHVALVLLTDDMDAFRVEGESGGASLRLPRGEDFGLPNAIVRATRLFATGVRDARASGLWAVHMLLSRPEDGDANRIALHHPDGVARSRAEAVDRLTPTRGFLRGSVRDKGGAPSFVWVSAGHGLSAATDAEAGAYEIALPWPGRYAARVDAATRIGRPATAMVTLRPGERRTPTVDFTVEPAGDERRIVGRVMGVPRGGTGRAHPAVEAVMAVLRPRGEPLPLPLAGAHVTLADRSGATVATRTTGRNGFYQFTDLTPGDYVVSVRAGGETREVSFQLAPDSGRMIAPVLILPRPEPWAPTAVALVLAGVALVALLGAGFRSQSVIIAPVITAPEASPPSSPWRVAARPGRRARIGTLDHDGPPLAVLSKPAFGCARLRAGPNAHLVDMHENVLPRRVRLDRPVLLEVNGARWRVAPSRPSRRAVAVPDPGDGIVYNDLALLPEAPAPETNYEQASPLDTAPQEAPPRRQPSKSRKRSGGELRRDEEDWEL